MIRVEGINGHFMGHITNGTYRYSGNWFGLYGPSGGGIPFTPQEMDYIDNGEIKRVIILDGYRETHSLTREEILTLGYQDDKVWRIRKYGNRWVVEKQNWRTLEPNEQAFQVRTKVRELPGPDDSLASNDDRP